MCDGERAVDVVAITGALPESRFAPEVPEMKSGAPAAVTVTPGGTFTAKLTEQLSFAHARSARKKRPPDTDCTTAGALP
jgi:hypothetical protein